MGHVIVRRATAADLDAFSDMARKPTTIAWVGDLDGRIIAVGGLARLDNRWFAFCDLTDDARPYKMTLMRAARRTMAEARRLGFKFVYAQMDGNEPGAAAWLERLGFHIDPRSGTFYRWKADT